MLEKKFRLSLRAIPNFQPIIYEVESKLKRFEEQGGSTITFTTRIRFLDEEENLREERLVDLLTITIFDETGIPSRELSSFKIITSDKGGDINMDE